MIISFLIKTMELQKILEEKVEGIMKRVGEAREEIKKAFNEEREKLKSGENEELGVLVREHEKANGPKTPEERAREDEKLEEEKGRIKGKYAEAHKKLDEEENAVMKELEEESNKATGPLQNILTELNGLNLENPADQRRLREEFSKMVMVDLTINWVKEGRKLSFKRSIFNGAPVLDPTRILDSLIQEVDIAWDCNLSNMRDLDKPKVRYAAELKRSTDNEGCWKEVYSGPETKFTAKGLEKNTEYNVRVRYVVGDVQGGWNNVVNARTKDIPVPLNLAVRSATYDTIVIIWGAVPSNPKEPITYQVEVDGQALPDKHTAATFTKAGLPQGTPHKFRVRAVCGNLAGGWSSELYGRTNRIPVPTVRNEGATYNTITVSWNSVSDATSYDIELDGSIRKLGLTTRYVHQGLTPNTTHRYRVRAVCGILRASGAVNCAGEQIKSLSPSLAAVAVVTAAVIIRLRL